MKLPKVMFSNWFVQLKNGLTLVKSGHSKNRLFVKLLLSYLAILVIPIVISWLAYGQAIREVESYTKASTMSMLKQSSNIIDRHLQEVNRVAIQLAMNQRLKELVSARYIDNYELARLLTDLSSYIVPNNFILRSCIYLKNSHNVFYSDTIFNDRFFYDNVFSYHGMSFNEWQHILFSQAYSGKYLPASSVSMERINQSVITYMLSIPFNIQKNQSDGVIFLLIDEKQVHNLLPKTDVNKGGWVYILDENGQIITRMGQGTPLSQFKLKNNEGYLETKHGGKPLIVTYTVSEDSGWTYVAALPRAVVMSKVRFIKVLALAVTMLSLVFGCTAAYFMAHKNAEPIQGIVQMISEFFGGDDQGVGDYDYLTGKVSELISSNNLLRSDLKKQAAMASAFFFDRLLKGDFKNSEEMEIFSKYVGVDFSGKKLLVLILRMYDSSELLSGDILKELDMTKVLVKDTLKRVLRDDAFITDLDENHIAVLIMLLEDGENAYAKAERLMNEIYFEIFSRYRIQLTFAAGNICGNMGEVSQSFEQARDAAGYIGKEKGRKILWYHELPKQSEGYYYSIDLETRLMNSTKAGDWQEVERYLNILWGENYEKRTLSPEMLNLLSWEMRGTLVKLKNQVELNPAILEAVDRLNNTTKSFSEFFHDITEIYKQICQCMDSQKRSHNTNLKNKMIEFISQTSSDASLSLSTVAMKFGLTESYISQFFKEQTGQNFSSYLEKIRMEHACDLLANSDMPINEIAHHVGYYSDQVFRRAFKRYHGMTPNEFRVLMKSKELDVI